MTIITHSSLECFQSCRRKYKLRYIDGIVPTQKSPALEFGSAMHAVLECYFNRIKACQQTGSEYDSIEEMSDHCAAVVDSFENLGKVDSAKLIGLMCGYIKKYYESDKAQYDICYAEVEFKTDPFSFETRDIIRDVSPGYLKYFYNIVGKVDGVVMGKDDGKYYIVEHKTASLVDDSYIAQKEIDSQTMTYALCLKGVYGIEVSGVIHDIITKQKIRLKKGESEDDFCSRLIEDVTDDNFTRIVLELDKERLDEFKQELVGSCLDLVNCKCFYKCTGNCIGRYGACEYLNLCRAGGLVDAIKDQYETRKIHEEISDETLTESKEAV